MIPKVRVAEDADHLAIQIHLFRAANGKVCGWYVGPVAFTDEGVALPYLPRSLQTRADVAVVRAIAEANRRAAGLCVVDPDDLWEPAWSTI